MWFPRWSIWIEIEYKEKTKEDKYLSLKRFTGEPRIWELEIHDTLIYGLLILVWCLIILTGEPK